MKRTLMSKKFILTALTAAALLSACGQAPAPTPTPDYLILLTKSNGGDTEASFLAVDNLEHCETRATGARNVFPAAGITYIAHYCVKSAPSFEPFAHNSGDGARTYVFDLKLSKDGRALSNATSYVSVDACTKAKGKLCVVSAQNKE